MNTPVKEHGAFLAIRRISGCGLHECIRAIGKTVFQGLLNSYMPAMGQLIFFYARCLPPSPGQGVLVERRCWRWVEVALPRAQGAAKGAWEAALALHTCRRSLRSFKTLDCMHLEELQTKTRLLHYRHLVSKNSKPRNPRQHTFREA